MTEHLHTDPDNRPSDDGLEPHQVWAWLNDEPRPRPTPDTKPEDWYTDGPGHWEVRGTGMVLTAEMRANIDEHRKRILEAMRHHPVVFGSHMSDPDNCLDLPHRGPAGPNEDIAQCPRCLSPTFSMRPQGETWGNHADDCSLPVDHQGFCEGGGSGHPPAAHIRG